MSTTKEEAAAELQRRRNIELPPGDYAIVELFGHTTLIGCVTEIERFGTKMLALEPLYQDQLLPPSLHGGASIYRLTPCSPEVALGWQPRDAWALPQAIRATLPVPLIEAPATGDNIEDQEEF